MPPVTGTPSRGDTGFLDLQAEPAKDDGKALLSISLTSWFLPGDAFPQESAARCDRASKSRWSSPGLTSCSRFAPYAPWNATVVRLFLGASSVTGAIFLIMELYTPFEVSIRTPSPCGVLLSNTAIVR